ncbi:MAG: tRNA pseudouridine(55) synthase TruB [Faecalibacterium sp.]|nr:tRNA pseudouridine(55) synthase TruB [Ruminococcus sp.]MCM1391563.1 tRNA pseudouridine(55) synthase TruB [Ruminococcus sp.]MCM1485120.1 tRNA pseudouridine(55) synthase TruB [Faecalibacterium sp.]
MTGFICVDKPQGITSFVAAAKLRRLFSEKKVGHTGTLDPMATGVLTVALGGATKFIELIPCHDKSYRAVFVLGKTTDTLDITGKLLEQKEVTANRSDVESALEKFRGNIKQLPPMYSAIKKNGVRLYDLARQGIEIEREERDVSIYSLQLISCNEAKNEYVIDVSCSSGTYIRSLISDIGDALGCGAVMTELRRTSANAIGIESCFTFEQLEQMKENDTLENAVLDVDSFLGYKKITVTAAQAKRFSNGGELDLNRVRCEKQDRYYNVYSPSGDFLGVGEISLFEDVLKVKRIYLG